MRPLKEFRRRGHRLDVSQVQMVVEELAAQRSPTLTLRDPLRVLIWNLHTVNLRYALSPDSCDASSLAVSYDGWL